MLQVHKFVSFAFELLGIGGFLPVNLGITMAFC
jgi:hypothetical protein